MADLKTDYKDDILDTSQNLNRTFSIVDNTTGTVIYPNVSLEETTKFTQEGDSHSAAITNTQNEAINQINADLTALTVLSTTAKVVGKDHNGKDIYERVFEGTSLPNQTILDANLTYSAVAWFEASGCYSDGGGKTAIPFGTGSYVVTLKTQSNGLAALVANVSIDYYFIKVRYVLN